MKFTGERMVPAENAGDYIYLDHLCRYHFAARFCKDKYVVDAACGAGFCTHLLALNHAKFVLGMDISREAVQYSIENFKHENNRFIVGDILSQPIQTGLADLAVAFEILEHIELHDKFIRELKRIMKPGGMLLISTPDIDHYKIDNAFHVRELTYSQFTALLKSFFKNVLILNQSALYASVIQAAGSLERDAPDGDRSFIPQNLPALGPELRYGRFNLAICSDDPLPDIEPLLLFDPDPWENLRTEVLRVHRQMKAWRKLVEERHRLKAELSRIHKSREYRFAMKLSKLTHWVRKRKPDFVFRKPDRKNVAEQKYNMIFFWKQNDTGIYGRRQEMIAKYLLETGKIDKILHIEPPVSAAHLLNYLRKALQRRNTHFFLVIKNTLARLLSRKKNDRFIEYTPFYLIPTAIHFRFANRLRNNLVNKLFKFVIWKNDLHKLPIILWCCPTHNFIENLLNIIPAELVCMDCIDDNRSWYPEDSDKYAELTKHYRSVLSKADIVFAVNQQLAENMSGFNPNTHWIPNGVEPRQVLEQFTQRKAPIRLPPHPLLGYVGNLSARLNTQIIHSIATSNPEWQVALIGSTHASDQQVLELDRLSNIHFTGPCPYPDVIAAIRRFDVAVIPHADNRISRNMDPMKVYLFLALGVPIVATACAGMDKFREIVSIATDTEDFILKIQDVLEWPQTKKSAWRSRAEQFIREHTWDKRAEKIVALINESLERKYK